MQNTQYSGCCAITLAIGFGQNYDSRGVVSTKDIVTWLNEQIAVEQRSGQHSIMLASVIRMQKNAIKALEQVGFVPITGKYRKPIYGPDAEKRSLENHIANYEEHVKQSTKAKERYTKAAEQEPNARFKLEYQQNARYYEYQLDTYIESLERTKKNLEQWTPKEYKPDADIVNRDVTIYAYFLGLEIES